MTRPHRHSPAARLGILLILPLAPAFVGTLRFVLPYYQSSETADIVRDVTAHQGTMNAVIWLGFLASLTLPVAAVLASRPFAAGAPRLTTVAEFLLVPAYLCLPWLVVGDAILLRGVRSSIETATIGTFLMGLHPVADLAIGIFVVGHVLGTVLLGIAAIRTRAIPLSAGIALTVCQPLHFIALVILGSPTLDLIGWGLNAVAFGVIALTLVRAPRA
ncbi:MAG: hypothetical protein ABIP45_13045 [Knoellia sp.]